MPAMESTGIGVLSAFSKPKVTGVMRPTWSSTGFGWATVGNTSAEMWRLTCDICAADSPAGSTNVRYHRPAHCALSACLLIVSETVRPENQT